MAGHSWAEIAEQARAERDAAQSKAAYLEAALDVEHRRREAAQRETRQWREHRWQDCLPGDVGIIQNVKVSGQWSFLPGIAGEPLVRSCHFEGRVTYAMDPTDPPGPVFAFEDGKISEVREPWLIVDTPGYGVCEKPVLPKITVKRGGPEFRRKDAAQRTLVADMLTAWLDGDTRAVRFAKVDGAITVTIEED